MADRVRRFLYQRSLRKRECGHLDQVQVRLPSDPECPECLAAGEQWVHVRMCLGCGHQGCCDSTKPQQHARSHYEDSGHPIIRSVEPGESWAWCYLDEAYLTEVEYEA